MVAAILGAVLHSVELGLALFVCFLVVVASVLLVRIARVVRDLQEQVRERDRVQESLRTSEQRYRALARNLPNGAVLLFDTDCRYLVADGSDLLGSFGLKREDIEGRTLFELVAPENRAEMEALYRPALAGQTVRAELVRRGRVLAVHLAPVTADDLTVIGGILLLYDITAMKRAEDAARRSEQRFRELIEAMPDMVSVVRDQRFIYANPAALRNHGYASLEELVGTPVEDVILHADDAELRRKAAAVLASTEPAAPAEIRLRRRDGSQFLAEYVALRMEFEGQVALVGIGRDVTERRRVEAAAREATALWRAILDSAAYSIIATSADGIIREFNAASERMLGYAAKDVVGKVTPTMILDPRELAARAAAALGTDLGVPVPASFETLVAGARRGTFDEGEWTYIRKDGSRFPVRLSVTALRDSAGVVSGFLAIASDITEQQRAREELVRAKETAEHAMRARSDFLARMSHEIRTPMNGVLGMAALALGTELTAEQREYIESVRSSAGSLLAIINDILDFSKIDAGKMRLEKVPFSLDGCVRRAAQTLIAPAHAKGLELMLDIGAAVPDRLIGDPHRLQQIITNLVANAVKFTDRGEVSVAVRALEAPAGFGAIEVEVADTGIGIPAEKQAHIFEAFTQADEATTRKFGGTGLGLAICSQLVGLMGGRLSVESEPGKGSRFRFSLTLPVDPAEVGHLPAPARLEGLRALVVDDHPGQRAILVGLLRSWRMQAQAVGPEEARRTARGAREAGQPIELLVLDAVMPGVDGALLEAALRAESAPGIPVVILSSGTLPSARSPVEGPSAVVMKPVGASVLLEAIQSVIAGARPDARERRAAESRPTGPRLRVLLTEDNKINRVVAQRLLERAGHEVIAVESGYLALETLERQTIDVVLMDVQMPGMDGLETTRALRASEKQRGGHVPVIALTAQAMQGDRESCLDAGMDGYVTKPLEPRELLAAIAAVTARTPLAGSRPSEGPPT